MRGRMVLPIPQIVEWKPIYNTIIYVHRESGGSLNSKCKTDNPNVKMNEGGVLLNRRRLEANTTIETQTKVVSGIGAGAPPVYSAGQRARVPHPAHPKVPARSFRARASTGPGLCGTKTPVRR